MCLIFLYGSCSKTGEAYLDVTDAAAVSLRSLSFGPQGATCSVRVQASSDWSLGAPGWIEADKTSGSGITDVVLSVLPYTEENAREGKLVFKQGRNEVCIAVRQQGRSAVTASLNVLDVEGYPLESLNAPFGGLHFCIRVETSEAWNVSVSDSWMNASADEADGSAEVYLAVEANPSNATRSGSFTFRTSTLTAILKIVQEGEPVIEPVQAPSADLLDVVFEADGSARDLSAAALTIVKVASENLSVRYNDVYRRYAAVFDSAPGKSITEGFYYADYENNTTVMAGLENTHSLEILLYCKQLPSGSHLVRPFSSMSSGGTGFSYSKSDHLTVQRRFAFSPYIGDDYLYTVADGVGVGAWHHVVGVWDGQAGAAYVYVDGQLTDTAAKEGAFVQAEATARHFVIGGDAYKGFDKAEASFRGEIAIARAYSTALSAGQALWLYRQICK